MVWLFRMLIFGHVHRWTIHKEGPLKQSGTDIDDKPFTNTGTRYILRCEKCGWIRKRDCI